MPRRGGGNDRKGVREEIQPRQGQREPKPPSVTKEERANGWREKRLEKRFEWQSRKANLTFISGILGFTPRRTLSSRIPLNGRPNRKGRNTGGGEAFGDPSSWTLYLSYFLSVSRTAANYVRAVRSRGSFNRAWRGLRGKESLRIDGDLAPMHGVNRCFRLWNLIEPNLRPFGRFLRDKSFCNFVDAIGK